jgi:hypothetical protein
MLEWILRRVREEETVVMMRMFPTIERKKITNRNTTLII